MGALFQSWPILIAEDLHLKFNNWKVLQINILVQFNLKLSYIIVLMYYKKFSSENSLRFHTPLSYFYNLLWFVFLIFVDS